MTEADFDARLLALERRVAALEERAPSTQVAGVAAGPTSAKPESAREFLNGKPAKTAVDKALVIAVWLERSGVTVLTVENISAGFEAAKEPLPSNPSDLLYQNGRRGYMAPARDKKDGAKAWYVTTAGEKFVSNGLKE